MPAGALPVMQLPTSPLTHLHARHDAPTARAWMGTEGRHEGGANCFWVLPLLPRSCPPSLSARPSLPVMLCQRPPRHTSMPPTRARYALTTLAEAQRAGGGGGWRLTVVLGADDSLRAGERRHAPFKRFQWVGFLLHRPSSRPRHRHCCVVHTHVCSQRLFACVHTHVCGQGHTAALISLPKAAPTPLEPALGQNSPRHGSRGCAPGAGGVQRRRLWACVTRNTRWLAWRPLLCFKVY